MGYNHYINSLTDYIRIFIPQHSTCIYTSIQWFVGYSYVWSMLFMQKSPINKIPWNRLFNAYLRTGAGLHNHLIRLKSILKHFRQSLYVFQTNLSEMLKKTEYW